jgi:murein DD-endopeptidase MepM/ murein hydrolase activator NlpD
MKKLAGLFLLALALGCAAAEPQSASRPTASAPQARSPIIAAPMPAPPPVASAAPTTLTLRCAGALTQGGVGLCRTLPGAAIFVDGVASGSADAQGWAVIGFNREHPEQASVEARAGGNTALIALAVAPRTFDIQRVDGLPQQTVTPTDPEVLARIQREAAIKAQGFASVAPLEGWLDGFIQPVEGRISGRWGNQRVLNSVPSTPHFGYDIAAPTGTPIRAPASGVVTLAQPDMHYEGGLVFIDHGQGLITMYLHMSRLDVAVGDHVTQGQIIGAVGSSGRATGPHLCWRMKWRERQLDPSLALEALTSARAALIAAN